MIKQLRQAEEIILSLLLTAMIVLSCVQILLRQSFDTGLPWIDPLLRHLVVWGGFLGAMLAVSQDKHISIDIVGNFLPSAAKKATTLISQLFSAIVCALLTYASWLFLQTEFAFGQGAFLALPSWVWNLIFPLSFAIMAMRYALKTIGSILLLAQHHRQGQKAADT